MRHISKSAVAAALLTTGAMGGTLFGAAVGYAHTSNRASATAQAAMADAAAIDAATTHAFSMASPSVVYVENVGVGSGSGVIYDANGDIVTNAHVVESATKLSVTLNSGKTYAATLVGKDVADDLAIIHIKATGLPAAHFAGPGGFEVAQTALAIGSPLGLQQSVTSGLISAMNRTVQEGTGAYLPDAIQTSAPINPGNSGGALVTLDGTVVGIPTLEASDPQNNNGGAAQGIGFAVPSTRVTLVAKQLISFGKIAHTGRAYLGVSATDASSQSTSGASTQDGAVVQSVGAGSPAQSAGLQQNDIIVKANGRTITGQEDLLVVLAHVNPGSTLQLVLDRNGSSVTVNVHLGELPAA
jgi:S1-C subfamily serine protease